MNGIENILIIGKVWPEPKSSAAGTRMMQLIHYFLEHRVNITFASTAKETEFQEDLKKLGVQIQSISLNSHTFDEFLTKLEPDAVLFDRFMTEEQFGWRVMEKCPKAMRILNTEDLHFLRYARQESMKKFGSLDGVELFNEKAFREVASIYRCDSTLMVSSFEMELLVDKFNVPKQKLYYLPFYANSTEKLKKFNDRSDFMFIGNFLHEPNWDAVLHLKTRIWPKLKEKTPNARLRIYGSYASQKVTDLHNQKDGFLIEGRVDNALDVIGNAKVCLYPLRFGAGIKGKILDAMQVGTPVVTTQIGSESMTLNGHFNGKIVNSDDEFIAAAIQLYQQEEEWNEAQQKGLDIVTNKFSKAVCFSSFWSDLSDLYLNLEKIRKDDFTSLLIQHHGLLSTKYLAKWIETKNENLTR